MRGETLAKSVLGELDERIKLAQSAREALVRAWPTLVQTRPARMSVPRRRRFTAAPQRAEQSRRMKLFWAAKRKAAK